MNIYKTEFSSNDLSQGDVLRRTDDLEAVLMEIHPYYFHNKENKFFIVLSQECDLVRRKGKECGIPYITIGAVRSLPFLLNQVILNAQSLSVPTPAPILSAQEYSQLDSFLSRIFNNNEKDYFFLPESKTQGFADHCCAFLRLSIPVKSDLHYNKCLDAKILELEDSFRAKLGYKLGEIFSRVGTEDYSQSELKSLKNASLSSRLIHLDKISYKFVEKKIKEWGKENQGESLDEVTLSQFIDEIPKKRDMIIDSLEQIIAESKYFKGAIPSAGERSETVTKIVNRIISDPRFTSLIN
jgi:hypothetical protein